MKKALYIVVTILLTAITAHSQTGWVTQNLSPNFLVKFPAAAQKITNNGIDIYVAKGKDSVGYVANVVDFQVVGNLDSATLAPIKDTPEFADQLKTGMTSTMPGYELGNIITGKWKNNTLYTLTGINTITKGKLSMFMILIGTKLYGLTCIIPANMVTKDDEIYFATAQIVN